MVAVCEEVKRNFLRFRIVRDSQEAEMGAIQWSRMPLQDNTSFKIEDGLLYRPISSPPKYPVDSPRNQLPLRSSPVRMCQCRKII